MIYQNSPPNAPRMVHIDEEEAASDDDGILAITDSQLYEGDDLSGADEVGVVDCTPKKRARKKYPTEIQKMVKFTQEDKASNDIHDGEQSAPKKRAPKKHHTEIHKMVASTQDDKESDDIGNREQSAEKQRANMITSTTDNKESNEIMDGEQSDQKKQRAKRQKMAPTAKIVKKMEGIFADKCKIIPAPIHVDAKCFLGEYFGVYMDVCLSDANMIMKVFGEREWPQDVHILCGDEKHNEINVRSEEDFTGLHWINEEGRVPHSLLMEKNWFLTLIYVREVGSGVALVRQLRVKRGFQEMEISRIDRTRRNTKS